MGDWIKVDGPYGDFTFEGEHDQVAMLSGGIGITPLRSICRYCTDVGLECKITLLYGNRTEDDIVFEKELEEMQQKNRNMKVVLCLSEPSRTWKGYAGRINLEMVRKEIPGYAETLFYTCGPPDLVNAMVKLLEDLDVPATRIRRENFLGY